MACDRLWGGLVHLNISEGHNNPTDQAGLELEVEGLGLAVRVRVKGLEELHGDLLVLAHQPQEQEGGEGHSLQGAQEGRPGAGEGA